VIWDDLRTKGPMPDPAVQISFRDQLLISIEHGVTGDIELD
jgi:hypothetical protein